MDNLQLRQRIVRSMIRVSERTANMRKPEKFEYRKHMTAAFMDMLELCIEANRARGSRRIELQNKSAGGGHRGHRANRAGWPLSAMRTEGGSGSCGVAAVGERSRRGMSQRGP